MLENFSYGHRAIAVDKQLCDHAIEAMLHFADFTDVGETVGDPSRYYAKKVAGSLALLRALVGAGRERGTAPPTIMFSSTAATYGVPQQQLISEDHSTAPINPYDAGKLVMERTLEDFGRAYGLRSVIFRSFNAARTMTGRDLSVVSAELGCTSQYPELPVILQHAWAWHQRRFPSPLGSR
jgi:UDP-glucose 4-epimerase